MLLEWIMYLNLDNSVNIGLTVFIITVIAFIFFGTIIVMICSILFEINVS